MILADENIDQQLIDWLRSNGIAVLSVREQQSGIMDEEVIKLSKNPPRIILTEDKDFGEWVYAHQEQNISVIFLRYHFSEVIEIRQILLNLLKEKGPELFGKFTTLTTRKIRIRSLR
jgi:predicted nuclease of predicted toxin-antitoxin system